VFDVREKSMGFRFGLDGAEVRNATFISNDLRSNHPRPVPARSSRHPIAWHGEGGYWYFAST